MDQLAFTLAEDGWYASGVPGFEAFELRGLRAVLLDEEPTLIAVSFTPTAGEHRPEEVALTPARLASLPGRHLASVLLAFHEEPGEDVPSWVAAMRRLANVAMVRPWGGSVAFSEEVADVVRVARAQGRKVADAIWERWGVSEDRANQYVREMKDLLGDRAPGDGRHERVRRDPIPRAAAVNPRRRAPGPPPSAEPNTARSRRVRHTPEENK